MIHLEDRYHKIVADILSQFPHSFFVFGSRAKGNHRPLSDLDLCFFEPIPYHTQSLIEEAFEESDLPFTVDLVDFNRCSDSFQKLIKNQIIPFS